MASIINLLFILMLILFGFFSILYIRRLETFLEHLKNDCRDEWEKLGKPSVSATENSVGGSLDVLFFLLAKKYSTLDAQYLIALGNGTKNSLLLSLGSFISLIILGFIAGQY